MIRVNRVVYSVLILCTLIVLSSYANVLKSNSADSPLSIYEQKKYKKLSENVGLYSLTDDVEVIGVDNFKSELYGNKRAWVIEFYNSWCGFCQRFAPSWKDFATDIKTWKGVIGIGALNCAEDDNVPICREFEIMAYPTIKYFHEDYKEGPKKYGLKIAVGSHAHEHRQKVLDQMKIEQNEGRGKQFPNLKPYGKDLNLKTLSKVTFLIIQEENDYIGPEVIMDLHKFKQIDVIYDLSTNTDLVNKFKVYDYPSLIQIQKNGTFQLIKTDKKREAFRIVIENYLHLQKNTSDIYYLKADNMKDFLENREILALKEKINKMGDVVFQMDLETALRFSLQHEISTVKEITSEKLNALKLYLNVLSKYFPFGRNGRLFLQELKDFVWYKSSVKGDDILKIVKNAISEDQMVFSSPHHWLGCKGSQPMYRGYPCSLWKLFHYLTVNAADSNYGINIDSNYKIVLEAMHGYIKNFFGCSECSQHFQDMAKRRHIFNITSWDDSILWLWNAHNEVNHRLSGDQTEDPEYPKYQFPSKKNCPLCYDKNNDWNLNEVLNYIKHMYSSINVRYIGSDTRILHLGLDGSSNYGYRSESGLFKTLDAAMCFILYLASFLLILIVIYMFLKRGYRKKVYQHDLLGKV